MKVLVIPTAQEYKPYELEIKGTLKDYQDLVGGYIQVAHLEELDDMDIVLICNEEGLLKGLEPNENLYPFFFVGQCVLVGVGHEDFEALTKDQLDYIYRWFDTL